MTEHPLVWFLNVRIKEDEAAAQELGDPGWDKGGFNAVVGRSGDLKLAYADRVRPSRFLPEVQAKRRILDEHSPATMRVGTADQASTICSICRRNVGMTVIDYPCPTVRLLALPYADHPDYRGEWKP